MKIKDLPQPYKEMALIEQEAQGNKRDENLELVTDVEYGNFDWADSLCGGDFWFEVDGQKYPEITPKIKAKFPSVFKDELIEKWLKKKANYEELAEKCKDNKMQHYKYVNKALELKYCIKDYQEFINLKK